MFNLLRGYIKQFTLRLVPKPTSTKKIDEIEKFFLKQERKLWLKSKKNFNLKIMDRGDVINFMQTYQRITQNMFRYMPKHASIILNLNSNHQIKSAVYKSK